MRAVRGMNDILPNQSPYWFWVESIYRSVMSAYGYDEIRLPLVEQTALFSRGIGEVTDIVEKEMYTFNDRNGESLSLRPEGTAGCVRAGIEHGLLYHQIQRFWYTGPMFRHERPQKGRYRQFHHLGAEAYGMVGPDIDAEMMLMSARFFTELGIADQLVLQLNSLGSTAARLRHREHLLNYLHAHRDVLDESSLDRMASNPLRILDSKNPALAAMIADAPKMIDFLDDPSKQHFDGVCAILDEAKQPYVINPTLVRGLDYYCFTVFEWVEQSGTLGAQASVAGGGRYDNMVELLGGPATPAIGFSCGIERLILLLEKVRTCQQASDIFMVITDPSAVTMALMLAERLRTQIPGITIETGLGGASVKSQFKRAIQRRVRWMIMLGEIEIQQATAMVKNMQPVLSAEQHAVQPVAFSELAFFPWFKK